MTQRLCHWSPLVALYCREIVCDKFFPTDKNEETVVEHHTGILLGRWPLSQWLRHRESESATGTPLAVSDLVRGLPEPQGGAGDPFLASCRYLSCSLYLDLSLL